VVRESVAGPAVTERRSRRTRRNISPWTAGLEGSRPRRRPTAASPSLRRCCWGEPRHRRNEQRSQTWSSRKRRGLRGVEMPTTASRLVASVVRWTSKAYVHTRMWASDQRDGRPAEHRWRPLFNAAKFGRRSLLDCCAVTRPRRKTCRN